MRLVRRHSTRCSGLLLVPQEHVSRVSSPSPEQLRPTEARVPKESGGGGCSIYGKNPADGEGEGSLNHFRMPALLSTDAVRLLGTFVPRFRTVQNARYDIRDRGIPQVCRGGPSGSASDVLDVSCHSVGFSRPFCNMPLPRQLSVEKHPQPAEGRLCLARSGRDGLLSTGC
ncbi:hypothetical protein VTN31DRAFT_2232 [Thermomyces dupontii]|uniref:uncharacterized protein n=1 Tax=Talaromyces thermophilus TaxID=28565 RepID=UPI0037443C41